MPQKNDKFYVNIPFLFFGGWLLFFGIDVLCSSNPGFTTKFDYPIDLTPFKAPLGFVLLGLGIYSVWTAFIKKREQTIDDDE